ncbi:retrovirus-related pol polyprotein from transposon TNT 1-94 [Tanacetum coccineum]
MIDSQMDDMIKEKLALKEQVDSLEQNLSKQIKEKECLLQTFTIFKNESKEKENKYMENEIDLDKKVKELDNIIFKVGQSAQTMHMLTKPQVFYDNIHKQALGYQNLFYLKKGQRIKPTLYDGIVIFAKHVVMLVIDNEETLILEEESRSKIQSKDFGKCFTPQQELSAEKAFWLCMFNPTSKSSDASPVKIETPKELPKVSLVIESLKKLKFYLATFDNVVKIRTTPDARTEEVQTVFDQMDDVVQQSLVDEQCLEIAKKELLLENDRLLQQIMSQDVLLTVMNSMSLIGESVNMDRKRIESCDKCFNLEAELLKSQNAHNESFEKKSMFNGVHDMRLLDFVENMNSHAKSAKKHKKQNIWKPTGRTFTIVGSSKKAKIVESKNANHSEPNNAWGSNATDIPSSSSLVMTVRFRNDHIARIMGYGDYQLGNVTISRVYYVEGLGHNLFSVGQFCDADLEVAFQKNTCFIRNLEGVDLLSGSRDINLYTISLDDMLKTSPICLLSKASKTKSWLWHRRLSHLNFGTLNKLAKDGLARGIPRLKFQKDHLCSACALGKSKKSSHQPKAEDTNQEKLYLLHMDLCGPMRVASINGKRYILVIVDDYSRFTWVRFLRTKDEAPEAIIKCIINIQVRLNATVRNVRTDNGTKFVNQTLRELYENVGISHQTSVAHTPQQNGVAEAINTTCYTQNYSLIRLRYNKTPYELMQDKKPDLSFFHVFGSLCYLINDNDDLDKLDEKADIGIFVGYAPAKKAFRIYNKRTRKIIETIHVTFDELTTMTSEQFSSGPGLHSMTPATSSSGLVSNPVSQQPCIPPKRDDWDRLFQLMFDEYFNPPSIDAPSTSIPSTQEQEHSSNISQGFEESPKTPIFRDDPLHESLHEDSTSQGSSSNVRQTHTLFEHLGKWTKDHPIENMIRDPSRSVSTRKQL